MKKELWQLFESQKGLEAALEAVRGEDWRPRLLEDLARAHGAEGQRLLELEAACGAAQSELRALRASVQQLERRAPEGRLQLA